MAKRTVVKKARPNGWMVEMTLEDELYTVWTEDDEQEFEELAEAEKFFADVCKSLASTPNWAAQARYDEEHGTVNGYSPGLEQFRREH